MLKLPYYAVSQRGSGTLLRALSVQGKLRAFLKSAQL